MAFLGKFPNIFCDGGSSSLCYSWQWHLLNLQTYTYTLVFLARVKSQYNIMIGEECGLSTLCHCCRFACMQRVLRALSYLGYFYYLDITNYDVCWYIYIYVHHHFILLQLNTSTFWWLGGIVVFRTLRCSCMFTYHQMMLKDLPGSD